jgi:hypothetical protein
MHRIEHAPCPTVLNRVAGFIGALVDADALSAVRKHFWHERKGLQTALIVQGGKDLLRAFYLYPISRTEVALVFAK